MGVHCIAIVYALYIFYQYFCICSIFHKNYSLHPSAVWKMDSRGKKVEVESSVRK